MSARPARGLGPAAALVALALLAGCATSPPHESANDWPMVPATRLATAAPAAAPVEAPPPGDHQTEEPSIEALVSSPVPPETASPLAELDNVFDRIRLGYGLPDVADRSVAGQVRYFAAKPEFLDRTFERAERYLYYVVR